VLARPGEAAEGLDRSLAPLLMDEGWGLPTLAPFAGQQDLSWHIIEHLVAQEFDVTTCQEMLVDHAFTLPLKLFWHSKRGDNFTTTTSLGERRANAAGYTFVRVEGFVLAKRPYDLVWQYWHAGRGDNLMTGQKSSLAKGAEAAQYAFTGFDGVVLNQQLPGTVPLKTFWSAAREDNFETATAAGEQSALAAGYVFVRTEGFVFSSMAPGLVPMQSPSRAVKPRVLSMLFPFFRAHRLAPLPR